MRVPTFRSRPENNTYNAFQILTKARIPSVFDADSYIIAVDNHSSCCMSNNIKDFVGPLIKKKIRIKGFQGATAFSHGMGTVKWKIQDDEGAIHDIYIKDTL